MKPEGWLFRDRGAATLKRVVPISERREADGDFTLALSAMEFYGGSGCVVRYLMDVYAIKLHDLGKLGPENFRGEYLWSDVNCEFAVRDQTGREYEVVPGSGGMSSDGETEYVEGTFAVEPLDPGAEEITIELTSITRESCYRDQPERTVTGDEERFVEELWTGPLSFTFGV